MSRTTIDPDLLRTLARGYLQVARDGDLVKSTTEQVIQERTVKIIIERYHTEHDGGVSVDRDDEHVTIKVGTPSRQEIVVAAPAKWLDPEVKQIAPVPTIR